MFADAAGRALTALESYEHPEACFLRTLADPWALARFAQQTRSPAAVDALASRASRGRFSLDGVIAHLNAVIAGRRDWVAWDDTALEALAHSVADMAVRPSDKAVAVRLLDHVLSRQERGPNTSSTEFLLCEALIGVGLLARAGTELTQTLEPELPVDAALLRTSVAYAHLGPGATYHRVWLQHVNQVLSAAGVESIDLDHEGPTAFDSLSATPRTSEAGPLVTVILPTHAPSHRLATAVRSLLHQSWSNLEVIVVGDGCSEQQVHDALHALGDDQRIRVLALAQNSGTYVARNVGLQSARGVFVTIHDDDDWSHPHKIEAQARHLITTGSIACMSQQVRTTEDLQFLRINARPRLVQPSFPSLMFRRADVVDRVGYWDEARRNADAEFRHRIEKVMQQKVEILSDLPLSFLRVHGTSLTAGEIQRGHMDDRRHIYNWAYRGWHARGPSPVTPGVRPSFPLPADFSPSRQALDFDLVIAADVRTQGDQMQSIATEIDIARGLGLSVALLHLNSPSWAHRNRLSDYFYQTAAHELTLIGQSDMVSCRRLLVRDPAAACFVGSARWNVAAEQILVCLPAGRGGEPHDCSVDPVVIDRSLARCLDIQPDYVTEGFTDDDSIGAMGGRPLGVRPWWAPRSAEPTYAPTPPTGSSGLQARPWPVPGQLGLSRQTDGGHTPGFFVDLRSRPQGAAAVQEVTTALALGVVVVLHRDQQPVYGDGPRYVVDGAHARRTIRHLSGAPDNYLSAASAGRQMYDLHWSMSSHRSRLRDLFVSGRQPAP